MLPPKLLKQANQRAMTEPYRSLQDTKKLRASQRPTISQHDVVLLLNLDAGQLAQYVKLVGKILELNKFDVPRSALLGNDGLESGSGVAVSTATIMKNDVYLFHGRIFTQRLTF
ncbi:MAG: hypothetical protein M3N22_04035 [Acidobacteriota bacterium]|nr:hypothetical protein [Acidobacteriota bacterium]